MDKLIVLLVVLLVVLLKINQYLKNKNTHKTAEELALDKKRKKNQEFWDGMDIYENHLFSDVPGNRYNVN